MREGETLRKYFMITLLLVVSMILVGCGSPKNGGGNQTKESDASMNETIQVFGQEKIVVKPERVGGAYVAQPAGMMVPDSASFQRSILPNGSLWGITNSGEIWGNPGLTGDWDFSDVRTFVTWQDKVILTRAGHESELEMRSLSGELVGKIDTKGGQVETLCGGGYALVRSGEHGSHVGICGIDAEKKILGDEIGPLPSDVRGIFDLGSDAENLYFYTADAAYRYALSEQVCYELFQWTDVGLLGGSVWMVWKDEAGAFYANDYESQDYVKITWQEEDALPKKKELTIAILTTDSDGNLRQFVTDFNKSQEEYHATIKSYTTMSGDFEDAKTRMAADMLAGDGPDLICHANLNDFSENLASGGYLMDLRPFLEESEVLSADDFYSEILEYGSSGDLLYTIPYQFRMDTLIVPKAQWKKGSGWTYDEMITYLRGKEEWRPFRSYWLIRMYLFGDPLDYFWDAETKESFFDGEEFRSLLTYVKECKEKESLVDPQEAPFQYGQLNYHWLGSYPREKKERGDIVVMGYPSPDGKPRTTIEGVTELSISATSKDPEGAWKFMESYLTINPVEPGFVGYALWSNRNVTEAMIERELALYGKEYEEFLNDKGETCTMYAEHLIDEEAVKVFRDMLAGARKAPAGNSQIKKIVSEESMAYFEDQKSLDQVIDAIQSRVKLFLAEQ